MTQKYLLLALFAAGRAGEAILDVYQKETRVEYKDDKSPLTEADRRSHEIIEHYLSNQTESGLPLLSEEGRDIDYKTRKKWEYFWMIDPLDGTKEFINRNGEFTVNIAIIHGGRPILGVIYVPVNGTFYFAANGIGSYKLDNAEGLSLIHKTPETVEGTGLLNRIINHSEKLPLSEQSTGSASKVPFTIIGSRSHATTELEDFVENMKDRYESVEFISAGSSLKFCLVAEGRADIYPRLGPTMEWDTAAGQAVVEQANGTVLNAGSSEPLKYNKENLLNPWFVVNRGRKTVSAL
ncbi:3'(2'),5'-bisphosphate nucleotidase CysQ [Thermodesulfobacteriota bacterium]